LFPASKNKRKAATQKERSNDKAKLVKFAEMDVTLEDDQSDEVSEVVARIEQDCSEELQGAFHEADKHSTEAGSSLRSAWDRTRQIVKSSFFRIKVELYEMVLVI